MSSSIRAACRVAKQLTISSLFAALILPTSASAQIVPPAVSGAEAGHVTAQAIGATNKINKGRNLYQYTEDFCKVLAEGTQALSEIRTAASNAGLNDQFALSHSLDKTADELQSAMNEWFWYYLSHCHPPGKPTYWDHTPWTALELGTYLISVNRAKEKETETNPATGAVQSFAPIGDPMGAGLVATYLFSPWNNNFRFGPYVDIEYLDQTVKQTFAGGSFLGTQTHWGVSTGGKVGFVVTPDIFLYGLAGVSWLNRDLNVNFATAASSNVITPGFTLGLGGEYHPSSWEIFGMPLSVFAQYQHTWWDTANFNAPASSPAFNYAFKRDDDTIKLGVNIYLSAPTPPPPTRGLIAK